MGIAPAIDLTADQRRTVLALLRRHLPNTVVWAYGSRVKWTSGPASDLDLVAFATPAQSPRIAELREAFDESALPFSVDLFVWDDVPMDFRKRIAREHVPLYEGATGSVDCPWPKVPIGDVTRIVGGGTPSTADPRNFDGEVPWLTPKDLSGLHDRHIARGARNLSKLGLERSSARFVPAKSVLLSTRAPVGYVCIAKNQLTTNQGFRSLVTNEQLAPEFLYYWLLSNRQELERHASGSTFKELPAKTLAGIKMTLPPKVEQDRVATVLGTLDEKTELCRRMATTMEDFVGTLFTSWFVNSDVGKIPNGWSVKLLGELLELAYGKSLRSSERQGGSIPVYGSNGQVGWHDRKLVDGPGIVVGRKGNPGVVTWSQRDFFPIDTTFYVIPKANVSLYFLFYALKNQGLQSMAADSAVPGLNRNIAYMSRQLVPDTEAMRAFDRHAASALLRRDQLSAESMTLADLRDWLLPKLVSGQIRVADAENLAEAAT